MDPGLSIRHISVKEQAVDHHPPPVAQGDTPIGQKPLEGEENEYRQQA